MKNTVRRFWILGYLRMLLSVLILMPCLSSASEKEPIRIGLTAEFGLPNSTSAQAIEMGIRVALHEINARGGVLGGRPLVLEIKDDRSVPARGIENVREFDKMKDMVAVFGGRFSPVMIELLPIIHDVGMILMDPWASADIITQYDRKPNFVFRLSLKDSFAMPAIVKYAQKRGFNRIGVLLPNTAWGRSNAKAVETANPSVKIVRSRWYNWGDTSLLELYEDLFGAGAQAILFVANDREASILMNEISGLPASKQLPILSHWGVTGGQFFEAAKGLPCKTDFSVVQSFSFFRADPKIRDRFMAAAGRLYPIKRFEEINAPVGVGHAYDLTHLLALAIEKAGSTDRAAIRTALEYLGAYQGLVANLNRPFTPENHDALGPESVFMARYREDGVLVPISSD
jgi:branched-chain amino acid transport system substrate-binding protein